MVKFFFEVECNMFFYSVLEKEFVNIWFVLFGYLMVIVLRNMYFELIFII